jgi:hypothetical protein
MVFEFVTYINYLLMVKKCLMTSSMYKVDDQEYPCLIPNLYHSSVQFHQYLMLGMAPTTYLKRPTQTWNKQSTNSDHRESQSLSTAEIQCSSSEICSLSFPLNITQKYVLADRLIRDTFSSHEHISSNDTYTQHYVTSQTEFYVQYGSQGLVQMNIPMKTTVNTLVTTQTITVSSTLLFVSIWIECSFMNSI